jgi:hypothetical protein
VVEVDAGQVWVKSTASGSGGTGGCVEAAAVKGKVLVRCSRNRADARLEYSSGAWLALLGWISDA